MRDKCELERVMSVLDTPKNWRDLVEELKWEWNFIHSKLMRLMSEKVIKEVVGHGVVWAYWEKR